MARAFREYRTGTNSLVQNVVVTYPTTPKVGDLCRYGSMIGYALENEDTAGYTLVDFGPREIEGVVAGDSTAGTAGGKIYFKDAAAPLTCAASGNVFVGYGMGTVDSSGNATIKVIKTSSGGA